MDKSIKRFFVIVMSVVVFNGIIFGFIGSAIALIIGLSTRLIFENPYESKTKIYSKKLLALSIVGLGAGLPVTALMAYGLKGLITTFSTIAITFVLGTVLAKIFKINSVLSKLMITGTAICGGSAIAAVAPVIKAKHEELSFALAVVFILNGLALILFPLIGHQLGMEQESFGLWAALAIHDTSSVVGATSSYGDLALRVGTTAKLVRALWILPIVFIFSYVEMKKKGNADLKSAEFPKFVLGFIAMSLIFSFAPIPSQFGAAIVSLSKICLVYSLYLIGLNVSLKSLQSEGIRPLMFAVILWIAMAGIDLAIINLLG